MTDDGDGDGGAFHPVRGQHVQAIKLERARALRQRMTAAERVLWQRLRGGRLLGLRFRRQQIIAGFIVDFYCHTARLVIEVDGPVHVFQPDYDAARDDALRLAGLRVLRVSNDDVLHRLPSVLQQIADACPDPTP